MRPVWLLLIITFVAACESENGSSLLSSAKVRLELDVNVTANEQKIGGRTNQELGHFSVTIFDASNDEAIEVYEDASFIPEFIEIPVGSYYFFASNNESRDVAFDAPLFEGLTNEITFEEGDEERVAITAVLANVKVTVIYDESVTTNFDNYKTTVSSSEGALIFDETTTQAGYFLAGGELEILAEVGVSSSSLTIDSPSPRDHFILTISYEPNGRAAIALTIDESTNDIPLSLTVFEDVEIWRGAPVTFTKANGTDPNLEQNQDRITDQVWITRANGGGPIYNAVVESGSDDGPSGTLWALGTTTSIGNVTFTSLREALGDGRGAFRGIVGKDLVMYLMEDNIYLDVKFTSWSERREGGFSYTRSTKNN